MNIAIKTPNFIGDTIMSLPAVELLRQYYPDATLTIICPASCVDIFRNKGISRFIIDRGKQNRLANIKEMIADLRKEHYDLGVLFHNTLLDASIFKLSSIDTIIGYNKENSKLLLDYWLKIDRNRHYVNHYAFLVNSFLGSPYEKLPSIKLFNTNNAIISSNSKPNVGFALGGKSKKTRMYPMELSLTLFDLLCHSSLDINYILLGDKDDGINNKQYEDLLQKSNQETVNLSGKTSVGEFIDTIGNLDLLITIDSSAMHIAAAVDTKFIVLLGKGTSVFETVKPKVSFGRYIKNDAGDIDDSGLIQNIKPEIIVQTIKEIINEN